MIVNLRPCTKDDWDTILDLRNTFYEESFYQQKKPITKQEHYEYMKKQEKNPSFHQWMAVSNDNVVGYIRILDSDISILVLRQYHNKGIGTIMLQLVENEAKKLGIKKLRGLVRASNTGSKQIFQKNEYELKMYWFEKDLNQ